MIYRLVVFSAATSKQTSCAYSLVNKKGQGMEINRMAHKTKMAHLIAQMRTKVK